MISYRYFKMSFDVFSSKKTIKYFVKSFVQFKNFNDSTKKYQGGHFSWQRLISSHIIIGYYKCTNIESISDNCKFILNKKIAPLLLILLANFCRQRHLLTKSPFICLWETKPNTIKVIFISDTPCGSASKKLPKILIKDRFHLSIIYTLNVMISYTV